MQNITGMTAACFEICPNAQVQHLCQVKQDLAHTPRHEIKSDQCWRSRSSWRTYLHFTNSQISISFRYYTIDCCLQRNTKCCTCSATYVSLHASSWAKFNYAHRSITVGGLNSNNRSFSIYFSKNVECYDCSLSTLSKKVSLSHLKGTSFVSLIVFIRFNFEMWIYRVPQKFSTHRGKLTLCKLSEMSFR